MANKLLHMLFRAVEAFLSIALIVVFAEVVTEVSARYIFHTPIPWGAEVSQTLLVWITFLGAAEAARRNEHMGVTFIRDAIPSKIMHRIMVVSATLVMIAFLAIGTWSGWQVVTRTWSMRTTSLQIPAGILYLALPIGFVIMILAILSSSDQDPQGDPAEADQVPPHGDWR